MIVKMAHKVNDILINDFEQTQNINEAKIICQNCNKINKSTSYNNIFFICLDCKKIYVNYVNLLMIKFII